MDDFLENCISTILNFSQYLQYFSVRYEMILLRFFQKDHSIWLSVTVWKAPSCTFPPSPITTQGNDKGFVPMLREIYGKSFP